MKSTRPICLLITTFAWALAASGELKAFPGGEKARHPVIQSGLKKAALQTYVPPGILDDYYMFVGNGHSGERAKR